MIGFKDEQFDKLKNSILKFIEEKEKVIELEILNKYKSELDNLEKKYNKFSINNSSFLTFILKELELDNKISIFEKNNQKIIKKNKKTLIIDLYGGPGTGKSTTAAYLKWILTLTGYVTENPEEVPKGLIWTGHEKELNNQIFVLNQISERLEGIVKGGHADIIISDSPILLQLEYHKYGKDYLDDVFKPMVSYEYKKYKQNTMSYFLNPIFKEYKEEGRLETKEESNQRHKNIERMLKSEKISYKTLGSHPLTGFQIYKDLLDKGLIEIKQENKFIKDYFKLISEKLIDNNNSNRII